jgi:hypothetical protein
MYLSFTKGKGRILDIQFSPSFIYLLTLLYPLLNNLRKYSRNLVK